MKTPNDFIRDLYTSGQISHHEECLKALQLWIEAGKEEQIRRCGTCKYLMYSSAVDPCFSCKDNDKWQPK